MTIISRAPQDPLLPRRFADRIGLSCSLNELALKACEVFELGSFESCSLVEVGYEDFNFVLGAGGRKCFVKAFANFRTEEDCDRYVGIMRAADAAGVATPKLLGEQRFSFHSKVVRACVMDHIDGDNLYRLDYAPTELEIGFLGDQASRIARIAIRPKAVYDSWAVINFAREYAEKGKYLEPADNALIRPFLTHFETLDVGSLPHCFVHGDVIATNVMRDASEKLWIIDFSVSNYYPRIQELAVLACNLCFDPSSVERSRQNVMLLLDSYQRNVLLNRRELEALPVYIGLAHAMHLLSANFERAVNNNSSEENAYWLLQGRAGLEQGLLCALRNRKKLSGVCPGSLT